MKTRMPMSFCKSIFAIGVSVVMSTPLGAYAMNDAQTSNTHPDPEYGYVREKAIEACKPVGEREYLDRLVCADGLPPTYVRTGNVGPRNEFDFPEEKELTEAEMRELSARLVDENRILAEGELDIHITDRYELNCRSEKVVLFLDMYHCMQPPSQLAPTGLGLKRY